MKTSAKILQYISERGQVMPSDLVDYLGITDRAIRKQLKSLLDKGSLVKNGRPPRVYYSIAAVKELPQNGDEENTVPVETRTLVNQNFFYISPRGEIHTGWDGFCVWCAERKLGIGKMAAQYERVSAEYGRFRRDGLIDGLSKMQSTFNQVALDRLFYLDFYSLEIFGKTRLGQLLLFAKQSQDRKLMNELADLAKPEIEKVIKKYHIDGVGFIPPTVKRELQLMRQIQNRLGLNVRNVPLDKIKTQVAVPQKTLNKLADRIVNARETISLNESRSYENILLIDDAVGSGATLNETAKKIRARGICRGKIIGLAITGSFKGFEVISEV